MRDYLLPIADREPLRWIVRERRTAFAEHRAAEAGRLEPGDWLFPYATRGGDRLAQAAGVEEVEIDLEAKLVRVRGLGLDDGALRAAVEDAGYEAE